MSVIKEKNDIEDLELGQITTILLARKSKVLVVSGWAGVILKIDLERVEPVRKLAGLKFKQYLRTIRLTPDEETLILYGDQCQLALFGFTNGEIVKDFSQVHEWGNAIEAQSLLLTKDGKTVFASTQHGGLKTFSPRHKVIIKDFGGKKYDMALTNICD
jgi:hypothetical protein